jgi:pyridoxine kinase
MLLVSREEAWHVGTPLLPFTRPPVGVGDLTTGLFTAAMLQGRTPREALEHTAAAYFDVMRATSEFDEYELQLVAAQEGLVSPSRRFEATPLL